MGSGIGSLGGALINQSRTIGRIGAAAGIWNPDAGTY
jgi:hypothetical protein